MSKLINLDFICNYPLEHKLKYEIGFCKTCPLPVKFTSNNLPPLQSVKFQIQWEEDGVVVVRNLDQAEIKIKDYVIKIFLIITYDGSCNEKLERTEFNISAVSDCRNGDFTLIRLNTFTICIQ